VEVYPAKLERKTKRQIDKLINDPLSLGEINPKTQMVKETNKIRKSLNF